MSNLRKLYDEFIAKRLAWPTIRRDAEEALLKAIVDEMDALRLGSVKVLKDYGVAPEFVEGEDKPKRGPGRPPKAEAT